MDDDSKHNLLSRRKFIKTTGTGAIGSTLLLNVPETIAGDSSWDDSFDSVQGQNGKQPLSMVVNGKRVRKLVSPSATLVQFLREQLGLTGTKSGCGGGQCGTCTVLLDGKAVYSCHMLALDAAGKVVTTIEGLLAGLELHPIQKAFVEHDGLQCGFCTPGQVMAAQALLLKHPKPTKEQTLEAMSGNLCRCAAYPKILESVLAAAK